MLTPKIADYAKSFLDLFEDHEQSMAYCGGKVSHEFPAISEFTQYPIRLAQHSTTQGTIKFFFYLVMGMGN